MAKTAHGFDWLSQPLPEETRVPDTFMLFPSRAAKHTQEIAFCCLTSHPRGANNQVLLNDSVLT
jgi:hypothetical protein